MHFSCRLWILFFNLIIGNFAAAELPIVFNPLQLEKISIFLGNNENLNGKINQDKKNQTIAVLEKWIPFFNRQDSKVICEHPGLYELLRQKGMINPNSAHIDHICPEIKFATPDGNLIQFSARDLIEVSYVIAGKGDEFASRYGHAMMGLKVCIGGLDNPHCNENTETTKSSLYFSEYISGFAAQTSGSYSLVGGLTGEYPTQMNFNYASSVRKKYIYEDFRTLLSSPLHLSKDQLILFLYLLEERFWAYSNHYKFLSNNCADEILKLLKLILPYGNQVENLNTNLLTPMELMKSLIQSGIADPQIENQQNKVPQINQYVQNITGLPLSFEKYLATDPLERRSWYARALSHVRYANKNNLGNKNSKFRFIQRFQRKSVPLVTVQMLNLQWQTLERADLRNLMIERNKLLWVWIQKPNNPESVNNNLDTKFAMYCYQKLQKDLDFYLNDPTLRNSKKVTDDIVPDDKEIITADEKSAAVYKLKLLIDEVQNCAAEDVEIKLILSKIKTVQKNIKLGNEIQN